MARSRTSSTIPLHLVLAPDGAGPVHRRLEQALRDAIRSGRLTPGSVLPSSRALAGELGLSRGVVVEAFEQLVAEGYLVTRPGGATTVAAGSTATGARVARPDVRLFEIDFRPGRPDLAEFPRRAWLRSIREVLEVTPSERLGYLDGRGVPELRSALSSYLDRARGTASHPDDVVISSGFAQGLGLVGRVLVDRGRRRIAVEDPSLDDSQAVLRAEGLTIVPIPVDADGLVVERLQTTDVDAVLVTSAHQYPTGAVLPPERRLALVDWARRREGLIVEDDYDTEFRYDRAPIGAIQGLDPDRVIYAGSASKVLAPGLRLGWLVTPSGLADELARVKTVADQGSPAIDQLAFADFLERGELDRHLRRMRPVYRRRRDALLAALARHLPEARPTGASAGLHVLVWLPPGTDEAAVVETAERAGIGLSGASRHAITPGPPGLVLGYGQIRESAIDDAVRRLTAVIDEVRGSTR